MDPAEVARVAASAERYPAGGGAPSVAEVLKTSGASSLGEASSVAEREEVARRLKIAAASLDATGRAVLRDELMRRLGFSAGVADSILQQAKAGDIKLQGGAMLFTDPEPWPEPVAGAALLGELLATIEAYVVLPRPSALAIAVWILHTHALDAAQISPRLAIISPEKRCGKSTVLKLLGALVRRPLQTTNVTTAVVFRAIEAYQPTLLVDEADTFLRDHDELRGVLNAGHDRQSARVARCVGDDSEPRVFAVWAPVAFAGIGKQHDTLMDRSVVIAMKRRSGSEKVAPFRRAQREALGALHRRCTRWATDNLDQLRAADPVAVPGLDDRAVDNWEALLAIADAAGAAWPEQVRTAAQALSSAERGGQGGCAWRAVTGRRSRYFHGSSSDGHPGQGFVGTPARRIRGKLPAARVVLNQSGRTPSRQAVWTELHALLIRHQLAERSFHALRHYFLTKLVRGGANLEAVRELAGHSKLHTTQRYVHATGADLRDAIARAFG